MDLWFYAEFVWEKKGFPTDSDSKIEPGLGQVFYQGLFRPSRLYYAYFIY